MINEEVTRQSVTIEMKMAKVSSELLLQLLKKLQKKALEKGSDLSSYLSKQIKGNSIPIKDMVKKISWKK